MHTLPKGSHVWVRDSESAWVAGVVDRVDGGKDGGVRFLVRKDGWHVTASGHLVPMPGKSVTTVDTGYEAGCAGESGELLDVKASNSMSAEDCVRMDDLSRLAHLNEPEVLSVLEKRFSAGKVYTSCGPVLLAINPLTPMRGLYSAETLTRYYTRGLLGGEPLAPHLFAVADAAYRAMVEASTAAAATSAEGRGGSAAGGVALGAPEAPAKRPCNQTILISGESGAGKTESAKILLQYLVTVGRSSTSTGAASGSSSSSSGAAAALPLVSLSEESMGGSSEDSMGMGAAAPTATIERRVLDATPILEAFGHANTSLNPNSSRFGKLIDLQFDARARLLGARVQVYLLEKVRIVKHSPGERGYHVFYQLLAGASAEEAAAWGLEPGATSASFCATSPTPSPAAPSPATAAPITATRDAKDEEAYHATCAAMRTMGLDAAKRRVIFGLVAAILHLSNVVFEAAPPEAGSAGASGRGSGSVSSDGTRVAPGAALVHLQHAARLLGVGEGELTRVLTSAQISIKREEGAPLRRGFSPHRAADVRDALCKTLYGRLFDWLVARGLNARTRASDAGAVAQNIFLLDIFGFESFSPDGGAAGVGAHATHAAAAAAATAAAAAASAASAGEGGGGGGGGGAAAAAPSLLLLPPPPAINSLEQLCINLSNETLQQLFLLFAYKTEQGEYTRESVHMEFAAGVLDNEDVLGLIAGRRPPGILTLLDETCLLPRSDDATFVRRLYEAHGGGGGGSSAGGGGAPPPAQQQQQQQQHRHARFEATPLHRGRSEFVVRHYAGPVPYSSAGFVEKNKDTSHPEIHALLAASSSGLCKQLFDEEKRALMEEDDKPLYARGSATQAAAAAAAATAASVAAAQAAAAAAAAAPEDEAAAASAAAAAAAAAAVDREAQAQAQQHASRGLLKTTVAMRFVNDLRTLMAVIRTTECHYIRCFKPNPHLKPGLLHRPSLVAQLRYSGVLEAMRVQRLGYPVRMPHAAALALYRGAAAYRLQQVGGGGGKAAGQRAVQWAAQRARMPPSLPPPRQQQRRL